MNEVVKSLIDEYTQEMSELKKKLCNKLEKNLHGVMLSLMGDEFSAVQWRQYTPYFNDGDTCYFGVHVYDSFRISDEDEDWTDAYELDDSIKERAYDIQRFLENIEDLLQDVYGDHKEITVLKEGVFVEDYSDHD